MSSRKDPSRTPPGPAVDASGAPVVDPTRNVLELVAAANRRQDDLREMESRHVREILKIREGHARQMRKAEAARIDSINTVNTLAVQQAAEVQDTRATALAGQVQDAAEAMRSQVAATTAAAATALATALAPITTSIEQLRQAMYEAQGQKKEVVETQDKRLAGSGVWMAIFAGGALLVGFLMFIMAAITLAALVTHGFTQ